MSALVQGSAEWLDMRMNHVGASDAPVIMGISPWKTPYQLWREKLGLHVPEVNSAMQRGTAMEEQARKEFELMTGHVVFPQVVFSQKHDWMMASLDGITIDGDAIVEIKCPGRVDHDTAKSGRVPDKYVPQLQHQLACTGLDMAYYFSFDGTIGVIVEVERDDDYIEKLIKKESAFWSSVLDLEAPPLEDRDYKTNTDEMWIEAAQEYQSVQLQLKRLEEKEKHLKDLLINMSGKSNMLGGGIKLSKIVRKGAVDYKLVPELIGVDLDYYRKDHVELWRISCK